MSSAAAQKIPLDKNVKKWHFWVNQNEAYGFVNRILLILMFIIFLLAQLPIRLHFTITVASGTHSTESIVSLCPTVAPVLHIVMCAKPYVYSVLH